MGAAQRERVWIAGRISLLALACSLAACGPQQLPSDCTELAQTAPAHLAAGRSGEARQCAQKLVEQSSGGCHSQTGRWLLARCAIVESTDDSVTIDELQSLQRGAGLEFQLDALTRGEMAVLLADAGRASALGVQRWLLEHAFADERRRCANDAYVEALGERLCVLSPSLMDLSTQCDFSSDRVRGAR